HLLLSFGGHPLAGGLSFALENLQVLTEAIDQRFWSQYGQLQSKAITIDLEVTIADLNKDLFNEFKQLEPFGMGNPSPKLLVRDCEFVDISNANIRTHKGQKVEYIKTEFMLRDRFGNQIHGDWWGHYSYELPDTACDVVIELVDNAFRKRYDARLLDIHAQSAPLKSDESTLASNSIKKHNPNLKIIDLRGHGQLEQELEATICDRCPTSWHDLNMLIEQATQSDQALALVYPNPEKINGAIAWQTLVGIAKYLSRTGKGIKRSQLISKLGIDDQSVLQLGFEELRQYGYVVEIVHNESNDQLDDPQIRISSVVADHLSTQSSTQSSTITKQFIQAVNEILFQQQFFDRQLISLK
ncbi:MAG: single-stranded-DNA-specific exonuclease RecJ, partial [Pseudanabaena sp.]